MRARNLCNFRVGWNSFLVVVVVFAPLRILLGQDLMLRIFGRRHFGRLSSVSVSNLPKAYNQALRRHSIVEHWKLKSSKAHFR